MADVEPNHGPLCSMVGDRCRSPHCRTCGGVADAQGFCPTCPREQGPHAPGFVLITPDTRALREALVRRPRLLILAEFIRDGEQYALDLGLPSRSAFEVVTTAHRLHGPAGRLYRVIERGRGVGLPLELGITLNRMVASGRLRKASDEDVAAIIAAWSGA